ncbi:MAG: hypothetical protein NTV43_16085 [Methylococcales bacterium]|nr:hypothetical protein [Methylococcales bacterium]
MKIALTLAVLLAVFALIGYSGKFGSTIDQSSLCLFDSEETAKQCKEGQLSFFQPSMFGNEQLPLIAAASFCDFNHQIIQTKGGVVCVFTGQRMGKPWTKQQPAQ